MSKVISIQSEEHPFDEVPNVSVTFDFDNGKVLLFKIALGIDKHKLVHALRELADGIEN